MLGKAAGACVRALVQALLLLVVIAVAGIGVRWSVDGVLGTLALLMLGTAGVRLHVDAARRRRARSASASWASGS